MDLATIIGLVLAWGAVLYSMFHCTEGEMGAYFKPGELFLVFGGSLGAAMLSMPLHNITNAVAFLKKWMFNKEAHIEHLIKEMVQYAETARRDGVLRWRASRARRRTHSCDAGCSSRSTGPTRRSSSESCASRSSR